MTGFEEKAARLPEPLRAVVSVLADVALEKPERFADAMRITRDALAAGDFESARDTLKEWWHNERRR